MKRSNWILGAMLCVLACAITDRCVHAETQDYNEDLGVTRHISHGSPFGIQDLVETRTRNYTTISEAGVAWIRLEGTNGLNWALVEEVEGDYDWSRSDRIVGDLTREGLRIFWTVSSFHPATGTIHFLPVDMNGYLSFLSAAVERYDGDGVDDAPGSPVVNYFQIENEVDGHFWEDTAANYAFLLKESIRSIKEASPNAKVAIAGAATPEGFNRFYPNILAEFGPGDDLFDVMDIHWYESVGDYAVHPKGDIALVEFIENLRATLPTVEIWFTEVGTHTGTDVDPGKLPQTETQQAVELVKRYAHFVGNGVARVFWHTMLESRAYTTLLEHNDFFDNMGLIYNGYSYINGSAVYQPDGVRIGGTASRNLDTTAIDSWQRSSLSTSGLTSSTRLMVSMLIDFASAEMMSGLSGKKAAAPYPCQSPMRKEST